MGDTSDDVDKDREAILDVHRRYNERANVTADTELLAELWDDDPSNVFFNLSGHNYRGLQHWSKLWDHYRPRVAYDVPWQSFDQNVTINGDVAWVTCLRLHKFRWIGEGDSPIGASAARITRSTEILVKRDGQWRVVHAHFSDAASTPRPGNV